MSSLSKHEISNEFYNLKHCINLCSRIASKSSLLEDKTSCQNIAFSLSYFYSYIIVMLAEGIHFQNSENARKKSLEIYQPQGYAEFNWSTCTIITKTTQKN